MTKVDQRSNFVLEKDTPYLTSEVIPVTHPDCKVHGANMGPTWGWQDPGGPHVGPMNLAIWALTGARALFQHNDCLSRYIKHIIKIRQLWDHLIFIMSSVYNGNSYTGITELYWNKPPIVRDHLVYVPCQGDVKLHCNIVSHWLGAYTKLSLSR